MATLTIRNLPDDLIDRIKQSAAQKGISMEQEVRDLLQSRYAQRSIVIERIRQRSRTLPGESASQVQDWKTQGRR